MEWKFLDLELDSRQMHIYNVDRCHIVFKMMRKTYTANDKQVPAFSHC